MLRTFVCVFWVLRLHIGQRVVSYCVNQGVWVVGTAAKKLDGQLIDIAGLQPFDFPAFFHKIYLQYTKKCTYSIKYMFQLLPYLTENKVLCLAKFVCTLYNITCEKFPGHCPLVLLVKYGAGNKEF